jgi:very-short-patch-repair endonuclease
MRVARGCYVPLGADLIAQCAAALSQCGPDGVVAGMAAAAVHGLWLPSEVTAPELARSTVGRRSSELTPMRRSGIAVHRWEISRDHICYVRGLPVTSIERTWWDLASRLPLLDLVAAGDRALQLGASLPTMNALVKHRVRRRGNANAREAIPLLDSRSGSRPESHLRVITRQLGLDCFEVNQPVHDQSGGWLATPDLACRRSRIALEYQGEEHGNPVRMRRDITRDTDLRHEQWRVLYYGPAQVFGRPELIGPELVALHADRLSRGPRHPGQRRS